MTYEMLQNLFLIAGVAGIVMTGVSAALFFLLRIPDVVGFLTGRTRKKGIDEIRKHSEDRVSGRQKSAAKKDNRTKNKAGWKQATPRAVTPKTSNTASPITARLPAKEPSGQESGLDEESLTTVLPAAETQTSVLNGTDNLTTVLSGEALVGTTVMHETACSEMPVFTEQSFEIEFEITYLHSDEVIK